ncbi:lysophospholipase-like protein 1 isoform X2 [Dreissena polymorpha]|uniref:lysophospholipase-like protein 1 isoform X2 n=1 Tax=Dreissena polymorpha TaxID=45954 RepID=UPI0022643D4F|nr:lysophospholipase-like protein 1 isoform X2 [Dreissena polymorpha]
MAAPMERFVTRIVKQTCEKATGSVIFLHGSGDTGIGIQEWVNSISGAKELRFPHLRILYPTAPPRPYTPNMGNLSTVWYDRKQISPFAHDDESVATMAAMLQELVQCEVDRGIPLNRIIIGGFSMGGGMALQLGYKYLRGLAGVFALSSFLSQESLVYKSHGEQDTLVAYSWGRDTYKRLTSLGVQGEFHSVPDLLHELDRQTLNRLCDWIQAREPPTSLL